MATDTKRDRPRPLMGYKRADEEEEESQPTQPTAAEAATGDGVGEGSPGTEAPPARRRTVTARPAATGAELATTGTRKGRATKEQREAGRPQRVRVEFPLTHGPAETERFTTDVPLAVSNWVRAARQKTCIPIPDLVTQALVDYMQKLEKTHGAFEPIPGPLPPGRPPQRKEAKGE